MKVAVIHHSLDLLGGGERVCMSLLRALDGTRHDTELRCVVPPPGVEFAGGSGGAGRGSAPLDAGAAPPRTAFRRVRLARVPRRTGPGMQHDFAAEVGDLFRNTGSDLAVVTDGGFVMAETDAPRVVWYCNSALRAEARDLSLPRPRHPRNIVRLWRFKRPIRRRIAAARDKKVEIVPNSENTRREVSAAIGRAVPGPAVYPPVDTGRFEALRGSPKERRTATVARFAPEKNLGRRCG